MAPPQPPPDHSSQRALAAIVFTDVVGFSARMQHDEMGTLTLLQRDFDEMRRICTAHGGAVLKTTGDGLLLTFSSAVHAVACALAMQRQFAAEAKAPSSKHPLQHRIGIHLGDILVQNQDVMGDGVNIAARLQAEAAPGGICISQTVYDVVKNKLQMQAVSLGPRELKNITQAMPVYRILLEAQALGSTAPESPPAARSPADRARRRKLFIAGGVVSALVVVVAAGLALRRSSQAAAPTSAAPLRKAGEDDADGEIAKRRETIQQVRARYLDKYDFAGFVRALGERAQTPEAARPSQQFPMMLRSAEQMVTMKDWLDLNLRRYNRQRPLLVHTLPVDASKDMNVFLAPDQRFAFIEAGAPKYYEWTELKPAVLGAIIVSALHEVKPAAPRDVTQGALAFARFYSLPLMQDALGPARARTDKDAVQKN